MRSEWPHCRLEEVASGQPGAIAIGPFGSRLKTDAYTDHGVALIRGTNLAGSKLLSGEFVHVSEATARGLGNANVKPWDLVFPHRGSIGAVGLVPEGGQRYALSTSLMKVTLDRQRVDPTFLYYYFRSERGQSELLKNASQVGTPGIATPLASLRACLVPIPSLREQLAAAQTLSLLDDRIELLRQTNATLESIAQALFKSWFIDFDPVRAKAEGREPEGMDAATAALFPAEFQESALGLIPKGWRAGAFGELAELAKGSVNPVSAPDTIFEHYSLPAFDAAKLPALERGESIKSNKTRVPVGAVLQSKLNPHIPRIWFPTRVGETAVCSTEFLPWMAKPPASPEVVYCTLNSPGFEISVRTLVTGTSNSHQRVKPDQVAEVALAVAPAAVYETFTGVVRPLLAKTGENHWAAKGLAELRDTLLPRLISGKLRLPEARPELDEALA